MSWGHPPRDQVALFAGDIALAALVAFFVFLLDPAEPSHWGPRTASVILLVLAFLTNFYVFDLYNLGALNGARTLYRLFAACTAGTLVCSTGFYLFPWFGQSPRGVVVAVPILAGAIYGWRHAYVRIAHVLISQERVLVIGSQRDADAVRRVLQLYDSRYGFVGFLRQEAEQLAESKDAGRATADPVEELIRSSVVSGTAGHGLALAVVPARVQASPSPETKTTYEPAGMVDLGPADARRLQEFVALHGIQTLVVKSDSVPATLASTLTKLRFRGIRVYSLPDFHMRLSEELPLETLSENWLCFAEGFDLLQARLFRKVKRLTDLLLATVGLALSLPILLITAIAIKIDSPGPVLFRQRRVGWMDQPFDLLKFRSMRQDAEADTKPRWATVDDFRVTFVGKIIRKLHVDEIPQIYNVLRGQMSFIGPRPERPEFVKRLSEAIPFYHLRHYVPPGITGWAQVRYPYGASTEDARRKLQLDLYYIRNASPLLDLRILLRTVRVILFREGSR